MAIFNVLFLIASLALGPIDAIISCSKSMHFFVGSADGLGWMSVAKKCAMPKQSIAVLVSEGIDLNRSATPIISCVKSFAST